MPVSVLLIFFSVNWLVFDSTPDPFNPLHVYLIPLMSVPFDAKYVQLILASLPSLTVWLLGETSITCAITQEYNITYHKQCNIHCIMVKHRTLIQKTKQLLKPVSSTLLITLLLDSKPHPALRNIDGVFLRDRFQVKYKGIFADVINSGHFV